jgi:hypothetical protein
MQLFRGRKAAELAFRCSRTYAALHKAKGQAESQDLDEWGQQIDDFWKQEKSKEAQDLFNTLKDRGKLTIKHVNLMMSHQASEKDFKACIATFEESKHLRLRPDHETYSSLARACKDLHDWNGANEIFRGLKKISIDPDKKLLTMLFDIGIHHNDMNLIEKLFNQAVNSGVGDAVLYTHVIKFYGNIGHGDRALNAYAKM